MGNNINPDSFYMHIKVIGSNMQKFYKELKDSIYLRNIIKYWEIEPLEDLNEKNINNYFDYLYNLKDEKRELLILKLNNIFDPEISILLNKLNEVDPQSEINNFPLVLILTTENSTEKLKIDTEKYKNIDPRLLFVANYTENPEKMEEIYKLLLRICSIHNELGDNFCVGNENNGEEFDLIEKNFPFNLNIACIGRFGQGKSTGVNALLQEYKAKESNKGSSQTKNLTFYQVKNSPIRILDIPGFENEKTVNDAIAKFKLCGEKINKLKDNIHIILYFLNFSDTRAFMKLEYPLIKEISKHESSKLIYVITHSESNINLEIKEKQFKKINTGIKGITKDTSISNKIEKFIANDNNVVFVNFHKDEFHNIEPFGKKELFKKIYDTFIQSEDYNNSLRNLTKESIEENALKLRAQAKAKLLSNKIWGGAVGAIPFVDWALQRFVIKKNAIKKVGEIFGIDVKFIDNENAKNEKKIKNKKEDNSIYISEIDGKKALKESTGDIIKNGTKCSTETGVYAGGATSLAVSASKAINALKFTANVAQLGEKAAQSMQISSQLALRATNLAAEAAKESQNMSRFTKLFLDIFSKTTEISKSAASAAFDASTAAEKAASASNAYKAAAQIASQAESSTMICRITGIGFLVFGIVLGVTLGGYFTHKFCEDLIEKFVNYYRNNSEKLANSYKKAAQYFLLNNENDSF